MYGKFISAANQLQPGEHYAILTFGSITIAGDERSRTNPGHGYPEHSETTIQYEMFTDRTEWETKIDEMSKQPYHRSFVPLIVTVPKIIVKTTVE